jgi:uncharacterized protein YbjT (DUF2867 family)
MLGVYRFVLPHFAAGIGDRQRDAARVAGTGLEGEQAIRTVFPQATILRPSLVFGEDDDFFSRFAAMIRSSPVLPLIGGGSTKFQPVFVDDLAAGLLELLRRSDTAGKAYERSWNSC